MRPSHGKTAFTANRTFVGREDARGRFKSGFADPQARDEYRILNWYGVGGQGKSALARKFGRIVVTDPSFASKEITSVYVDLDSKRLRHPEEALLSVRQQLAPAFGHRFAAFDTAYARYFRLTNPGVRMREKHPELFRGENELLTDLLGWSGEGIGEVVEDVAKEIPGASLLYKYGSRLSARLREWYDRRGKQVLAGLDLLTADEIAERLPVYLGADICDLLEAESAARIAVIFDTYEALWRDHNVKDQAEAHRADQWVRSLVRESPGVLFILLGRDKLVWECIDPAWTGMVESHLLGALSDEDADDFLRGVPIDDAAIRATIISGAKGLPFYLDLQVDTYADALEQGQQPKPALFGGDHPAILARFLEHLADEDRRVLRLASYPLGLSEAMLSLLAERFLGGIGHLNWGRLTRFSFIEPTATGGATMHALMREKLQERERAERPDVFRAIHGALFDHFEPLSRADLASQLTRDHDRAFEEALVHAAAAGQDWLEFFWSRVAPFCDAARYTTVERLCRAALGLAAAAGRTAESDCALLSIRHDLARQIGNQGRYAEAEQEFRAILAIRRRPEVLGEEHPDTLSTKHELARQIGYQGRYAEAEREFRAVWMIERRPDVLGEEHPQTLATQHNIARQIGYQGQYAEAEREFRAVWMIERRPDVLGEEHPQTLATRHNLARHIGIQGRYSEAEQEFRAIWAIRRRPDVLGEEHPATLTTRHELALQMGNQGRHYDAEQEFRAIWAIERRPEVLGEEHPDTLTTRHNLAQQIGNQGRHAEAEREFHDTWAILRRPDVLGETHPNTLITRHQLAQQIGRQGRYVEAEKEFRAIWAIERRPEIFGEAHPYHLETRYWLARMLDGQGKYSEADAMLDGLAAAMAAHFPEEHRWRRELADYLDLRKGPS